MHFSLFSSFSIWTLSFFILGLYFYLNSAICFWLLYDILDYLVMGYIFYDMFSIINCSFMQWKFYLGPHSQKHGLKKGSFAYDIGVLLLGEKRYTSLDPTLFFFMHFSLFSCIEILSLSFFHLGLVFYVNCGNLIYDISD